MVLRATTFCLIAVLLSIGVSLAKSREIKLKAKGASERVAPGGTGSVFVTLKNRTGETKEVTVTLRYRDIDSVEPIATATVSIPQKSKVVREFDVSVPEDWFDRRLRVIASIPDAESKARIRTLRSEFTDELWLRGEALYREECGKKCHGATGGQVKNRSLTSWTRSMRDGPGNMPRYPDLSRTDIVLMRQFSRDAKRVVE